MRIDTLRSNGGRRLAAVGILWLMAAGAASAAEQDAIGFELTPPRVSFIDGAVSFWRPGAEDWTAAVVNIPLAPGDELYSAEDSDLEIQAGARAFVRAGAETQLGLATLEPDYLQVRVTSGQVSLDLRSLEPGQTFELATPNAAFTVEQPGYYRVEVDGETTIFTNRRGGQATVTPAAGSSFAIAANEQVVVTGTDSPRVETYAAPEIDAWDRWNYARTDSTLDAMSARYVPSGVYGLDDLDHNGDWRVVPTYGAVWVPRAVPAGWAPYTSGRWIYDPYYGWSWVDYASWGWAPYHYGRWVYVSGYWGWCPGPIVVRPYYAPALVAFYSGGGFSFGFSFGTPYLGWVALGWGEPLVPWWGPAPFRRYAYWAGWGGPYIVNNIVIDRHKRFEARGIHHHRNADVHGSFVAVKRDDFGHRSVAKVRQTGIGRDKLELVRGDLAVRPGRDSVVADAKRGKQPPRGVLERSVVATRKAQRSSIPGLETKGARAPGRSNVAGSEPAARVVSPSRKGRQIEVSERAPFGNRGANERQAPPPPPRYRDLRQAEQRQAERRAKQATPRTAAPPKAGARAASKAPAMSKAPATSKSTSRATAPRRERAVPTPPRTAAPKVERAPRETRGPSVSAQPRELPGRPANEVYRRRSSTSPRGMAHEPARGGAASSSGKGGDATHTPAASDGRGGGGNRGGGTPATRRGR